MEFSRDGTEENHYDQARDESGMEGIQGSYALSAHHGEPESPRPHSQSTHLVESSLFRDRRPLR